MQAAGEGTMPGPGSAALAALWHGEGRGALRAAALTVPCLRQSSCRASVDDPAPPAQHPHLEHVDAAVDLCALCRLRRVVACAVCGALAPRQVHKHEAAAGVARASRPQGEVVEGVRPGRIF